MLHKYHLVPDLQPKISKALLDGLQLALRHMSSYIPIIDMDASCAVELVKKNGVHICDCRTLVSQCNVLEICQVRQEGNRSGDMLTKNAFNFNFTSSYCNILFGSPFIMLMML